MGLDSATSKWWVSSMHFESFHLSCFPKVSHQSLAVVSESLVTLLSMVAYQEVYQIPGSG